MLELLEGLPDCSAAEQRRRREIVVTEYLPVARSIAARYRSRGIEKGDLEQLACLGLVKAVNRWIPGHSEDFLQYAVPTISGEIKRYFRDHSWLVRPPRRLQERRVAINELEQDFWQSHGRQPTDAEVGKRLGFTVHEVDEARTSVALCRPPSLDAPTGTGWMLAQSCGQDDDDIERVEDRLAVSRLLATLTDVERQVVQLRFGAGWSQSRIAQEVGVSQMQVSRWLRSITRKLRAVWN
jgi:RNA polymerase sigma-B factor